MRMEIRKEEATLTNLFALLKFRYLISLNNHEFRTIYVIG
jgi:hypothetical protein